MDENPITSQAEALFRQAARQLGARHGAAGATPYVAAERPAGDYGRSPAGYTAYLSWEDGVLLLLPALGVPVPDADEGGHVDACWRIAAAYMDAYDTARNEGLPQPPAAPGEPHELNEGANP